MYRVGESARVCASASACSGRHCCGMNSAFMSKRWLLRARWVVGGLAAWSLAACATGSPSEQIVRPNLPAEQSAAPSFAASPRAASPRAASPKAPQRASSSDKSITSQEVERELNRLEAELR